MLRRCVKVAHSRIVAKVRSGADKAQTCHDVPARQVLAYWHTSLADATLPTSDPKRRGVRVTLADLSKGTLPDEVVSKLRIETGAQEKQNLDVTVLLFVARKTYKGRTGQDSFVCPLIIPAQVDKSGTLQPPPEESAPWIPRTWLEPIATSDVVLGSVDALEMFLTTHLLTLPEDPREAWNELLFYAQKMLEHVSQNEWRMALERLDYQLLEDSFVIPEGEVGIFSKGISTVYEQLTELDPLPRLLETYAQIAPSEPALPLSPEAWEEPAKGHLGSFSSETALSPSQREALLHALLMCDAEVLAVSGPPGTGKTTLLQSVVASEWVAAALAGRDAPVIVTSIDQQPSRAERAGQLRQGAAGEGAGSPNLWRASGFTL